MEISSLNKKLRLNMIIGKPAIRRWFERNKDFDWLLEISNNDYITKYNILRSDLVKKEQKEVKPSSFEERIKGRKSIHVVATCSIEVTARKKDLATIWTFHKSRFGKFLGESIKTGWDKGMYVKYDDVFQRKVEQWTLDRAIK